MYHFPTLRELPHLEALSGVWRCPTRVARAAGAPVMAAAAATDEADSAAADAADQNDALSSSPHDEGDASLFRDESFPPNAASVHGPGSGNGGHTVDDAKLPTPHSWRRFADLWPLESLPPSTPGLTVQQGPYLGDCWLLSPLAALAARQPARLRELFSTCTAEEAAEGRARVRLCPHGWWREVEVDTLLPCDERRGGPSFAARPALAGQRSLRRRLPRCLDRTRRSRVAVALRPLWT